MAVPMISMNLAHIQGPNISLILLRLTVYDGMYGTMTWNKTGDFCRRSQRPVLYSSGQFMRIVFTTDSSRSDN